MTCSKAEMTTSQFVSLSSGFHVSPDASRSTQDVGPAEAHLELEQSLHLVLQPAPPPVNGTGCRHQGGQGGRGRGGGVRP